MKIYKLAMPACFLETPERAWAWAKKEVDIYNVPMYEKSVETNSDESEQDKALLQMCKDRCRAYSAKYHQVMSKAKVKIFRVIKAPSVKDIDFENLGTHWSFEKSKAGAYGDIPRKWRKCSDIIVTAIANTKDIDWQYCFTSFMYYGENQWECALDEFAPIKVIEINGKPVYMMANASTNKKIYKISARQSYRVKTGKTYWFEYRCWESHKSDDAELWYKSHQMIQVLQREEDGYGKDEMERGIVNGQPACYKIRFADGSTYTATEDEILDSKADFIRPDPPKPRMKRKAQVTNRGTLGDELNIFIKGLASKYGGSELLTEGHCGDVAGDIYRFLKAKGESPEIWSVVAFFDGDQHPEIIADPQAELWESIRDGSAGMFVHSMVKWGSKWLDGKGIRNLDTMLREQSWGGLGNGISIMREDKLLSL